MLRRFLMPAVATLAAAGGLAAAAGAAPTRAQTGLTAYQMVDQWPRRDNASEGLFQSPSDLDVSRDGHVFIADPGVAGVHRLLPSGEFLPPFGVTGGFPQQLGRVGPLAVGPAPADPSTERVYVLDTAVDRVVIYGLDGAYIDQWEKVPAESIAAAGDGTVYILDRETTQIVAIDGATGQARWRFGVRGLDDGQLTSTTDLAVSPDGAVVAVGDKNGLRAQLFDVAAADAVAGGAPPLALRQVYDLRNPKYTQGDVSCRATRVNALGGDSVFLGEAAGACVVTERDVAFAIAASANKKTICRETVTLPRLRADTQQYFALAVSNPNTGNCGQKRQDLKTSPVVVSFEDNELRQVKTVWQAASNEDSANPVLFSPESISMPAPGVVFVQDQSSQFRFFDTDGKQLATAAKDTQVGDFSTDFEFFSVILGVGTETMGEVYGYYLKITRQGQGQPKVDGGIGRFKTVEKRGREGTERIIESVWTDQLASSFQQIEVPAISFNPVSGELLVVRSDLTPQTRTYDVRIVRYAPDGRQIKPEWDLPDDGKGNPYTDMEVGPDGRVYVLDDLADIVRVYAADGTSLLNVPVAFDARSVSGGPGGATPAGDGPADPLGSVFVLREPGYIERYADDGTVTARFDARPLAFSDPTTLTDLTVDSAGRVYVADGQSSLISVFEPSADPDALAVPEDRTCTFRGHTAADPLSMPLGASTTVTYTLDGRCGIGEEPADIVVVVPYLSELQQGADPSATTITELKLLAARLDFSRHRIGLVSYYNTTALDLPLTGDRSAYMRAVEDIQRFTPAAPTIRPRLKDAMEEAAELFDTSGSRRKVMVLDRAAYCSAANEFFPGQCAGIPPAEDTAAQIRLSGVTIIAITSFGASDLASSDEDVMNGTYAAHRRMVRYGVPDLLATGFTLTSAVPATMDVEPGSLSAAGSWLAPNMTWSHASLDAPSPFSARLKPRAAGTWPVTDGTFAEFVDGWGQPQRVPFPSLSVEVVGPPATATSPATSTPPPAASPTSTATPETVRVYLPFAARSLCWPQKARQDIVLVVDVSNSMADGGLATAVSSIRAFLDVVGLADGTDRVALVDFATEARVAVPLSSDRAMLDAGLTGLTTRSGTRIDRGLEAATGVLAEGRRPTAKPVIVVLSDGRQVEAPERAAAAADEARRAHGIEVYAIGFGADVDRAQLEAVAGDPARVFLALTGAELAEVYRTIAAQMPGCP